MIRLRSLGECVIEVGETRIGPQQEVLFALLVALVLESGRAMYRQEIVDLLWPDSQIAHARHRLRQALYRLRSLGVTIAQSAGSVQLDSKSTRWDVDEWLASDYEVRIKNASVGLGFLPNYQPATTYPFAEFIDRHRRRANARICRQLARDLEIARSSQDWAAVDLLSRRLLQLDPLHEEGTLALAESTARYGSKHQALQLLDGFVAELGPGGQRLTLPASALRRRISDLTPPSSHLAPDVEKVFVGRSKEHRVLSDAISRTRNGAGGTIWLFGPAGIGKSRLAQEALTFASFAGAQTIQMAVGPTDARHPLSTISHLSSALTDLRGALGCSPESLSCLQRLAGREPSRAEGLGLEGATNQLPAIKRALLDILDALTAESPVVVLLDDINWLDRFSRALLEDIALWASDHRLLLILTSRARPNGLDLRLLEVRAIRQMDLAPLNSAESGALLTHAMSPARTTPPLDHVNWCIDIAQGNPLYLKALGAHWVATGEQYALPPSLSALLVAQVSLLSDIAQLVLQASALLGRNCTQERLERVLELPTHQLCRALGELEHAGMLSAVRSVQPRHDLIADAVLAQMASAPRSLLHRRAAMALEDELSASGFSPLLWDIAHHWNAAGDGSRVLATTQRCAAHLTNLGLPGEAADVLAEGSRFCFTLDEKHEVSLARAHALHLAGRYPESLAQAREARALGLALQEGRSWHSDVELVELEARWRQDEPIELLLRDAQSCVLDSTASREHRLEAARWALVFADNMGSVDSATALYQSALPIAATDLKCSPSWCTIELIYHASFGELNRALEAAQALIAYRRERGSYHELSRALRHASTVYFAANRESEGEATLLEAFELGRRYRLAGSVWAAAERLACRFLQVGLLDQAHTWVAVAAEWLGATRGDNASLDDLSAIRARIALAENNPLAAAELSNPTLESILADRVETRRQTSLAYFTRLRFSLDMEMDDESLGALEQIVQRRLARIGQDGPVYALCLALTRRGELGRARRILSDYLGNCRRDQRPVPRVLAMLLEPEQVDLSTSEFRVALLGMEH